MSIDRILTRSFRLTIPTLRFLNFCAHLEKKKRKIIVVMESTGGYERLLLTQLASHQLEAAVINPRRIRDFARGIGLDAKTDVIDAKVISKYAGVLKPLPMGSVRSVRSPERIGKDYRELVESLVWREFATERTPSGIRRRFR